MIPFQTFQVTNAQVNQTLAALLRQWLPGQSWSQVRQLVSARRVRPEVIDLFGFSVTAAHARCRPG